MLKKPENSLLDCVAALLVDESNALCLQHRDKNKNIFFPGLWGLFGGSVEANERPEKALIREIYEELEIIVDNPKKILTVTIGSPIKSLDGKRRHFFLVKLSDNQISDIVLHEGQGYKFFEPDKIPSPQELAPVDACGIIYCCHTILKPRVIVPEF